MIEQLQKLSNTFSSYGTSLGITVFVKSNEPDLIDSSTEQDIDLHVLLAITMGQDRDTSEKACGIGTGQKRLKK